MKNELTKGKEVVSAEAGAYEMSPESSMSSHPGGLGARREGGMLARWDAWAGTSLQNQTVLGMLRRMAASPPSSSALEQPLPCA